ncbi:MAG: acyl-CoA dehydrogenase family protein [Myxococcota bacterium]
MGNFYKDNDDLRYYIERGFDWEPLVRLTEFDYRDPEGFKDPEEATAFYRDVLEMIGQFAAEEIGPYADEIDRQGMPLVDGEVDEPPRQKRIFEQIKALGLHGMCLPRPLGGLNCPLALYMTSMELFARGDVSVCAHHGFHGGMAMAMLFYSIMEGTTDVDLDDFGAFQTRFEDAIREIAVGDAWGCMDITEPGAGSDMAAMRTVGEQDEEGNWTVTGQKIYITSGHGKYHFVIARTEPAVEGAFEGLDALSFFLVKMYDDTPEGRVRYATVDRLEEKLGHHGSATASLTFDKTPAQLVGKRGEGFRQMLLLMNNARIGVGFECLGLCESALRMARAYAAERPSMGKTIDRHEMIADYLDEMDTDIRAIRAMAMHGVYHEEIAQKLRIKKRLLVEPDTLEAKRLEAQITEHKRKARAVTPLLKYLAAEKAVEIARRCIQIHGGNGYTKDYGAEKLLRDALVMPIYEGTSQIQALMAMKDALLNAMRAPQEFVKRVAQARWRSVSARDPAERRLARLQTMSLQAQQVLISKTALDKLRAVQHEPLDRWPKKLMRDWDPKHDFAFAMLHAERLTQLMADVAACELLYTQAKRHPERRPIFERYLERAEPRGRFLLDQIQTTGARLLSQLAERNNADAQTA